MFKRIVHILILMVFIGACAPGAHTPTPDTPAPEQPPPTTAPEEPPEINEPPLPVLPSERDHHPYNWQPEDVQGLDPWGDSTSDATDIVAIYQREMDDNLEFRLDILNFEEDDDLAPIYFAINFTEGGNAPLSSGSSLSFDIEWDLLASVVAGEFKLYDPAFSDISDQLITTEINQQLDFVFFAIPEEAFAGWDESPFQIQAMLLNSANSAVLDATTPVATDSTTGRAKLILPFADTFYGQDPGGAAFHYDGFREAAASDWTNERADEHRGVRYLLDAVERYEIPLSIIDHRIEEFPGSEYLRYNERIRFLASKGLLDTPFILGYGHFMPWQPDDIDAKAIKIARELREGLELPISDVFYPYEGMLTPGDIQVIKDAGFGAIYAPAAGHYSFLGWGDWDQADNWNQTAFDESIRSTRKIHTFNGMKIVFDTRSLNSGFVVDERWGEFDWENDYSEFKAFFGTGQGLFILLRRVLHDLAIDPDQEQFFTLESDLAFTPWGFQEAVEWNFQWLASHPWIEVTTFSSIVNRGWQAIDHGELDAATDELLMRYTYPEDEYYNAYFPQHYYGGISDGHSPLIPAGAEIESYYDYVPYLRDGELIPSRRIMGDDKTPGSIVYETLANLREAPDNPITTLAWLSYLLQIGEQSFHEGEKLRDQAKRQANFVGQVNKIVEAAFWAAEAEQGTLSSDTLVLEKDLDLDGELEYVMSNDRVFAIFENDGGRLEYAFAYHPDYGPVQLISPASQYSFFITDEASYQNGEVAIPLALPDLPDGAFVEDIGPYVEFEYVPLTASIEGHRLTFSYPTHPVSKTFTLEGDTIHVHYDLDPTETLNLGLSISVNQLGVFDKDWIWNFEPLQMQEALGWQMTNGGAVLLNTEDTDTTYAASFFDSPARGEMQQRANDRTYPEGHWMCFPCSLIRISSFSHKVDFSLMLSAAPIDKSAYTPIPTPTPTSIPPTPGPTPSTGQIEGGYVAYADELTEGWSLDPWAGTADLFASANVYQDSSAIEISLVPDGGAITFDNRSFDSSPYDYMVFYLNGGATADQELYVEMISVDNLSLGKAALAEYIEDYPLQPGGWHRVMIPLSTLNPSTGNFGWFDIGDASGGGTSTFYIDEIRFVSTEP